MTSPRPPPDTPFLEPLPFYLTTPSPSQYLPLPHNQRSLVNDQVGPSNYRPEDSLIYLHPPRTFEYKQYKKRLPKENATPGPGPFQPLQLPNGGGFLLGTSVPRVRLAKPGPGSYSPEPTMRCKIPCAAGWRVSPSPTPTAQAAIDGSKSAGPGSFVGIPPLSRIGSVSWGTGVSGRFTTQTVDQTGPLLGPGSYNLDDIRCFGRSGSSTIIRAEHDTAVLLRRMKNGGGGAGESTTAAAGTSERKKAVSPAASPGHGSKNKTKQILEAALKKTALEIRDVSMRELERDHAERLALSHSELVFRN